MRYFDFARKIKDNIALDEKAFKDAKLPVYLTSKSAAADFFCAETVTIEPIWKEVIKAMVNGWNSSESPKVKPVLVHTGVKAYMEDDEALEILNRSGNPGKLGLVLANGIGLIDADYADNINNDGEIMFAFYNFRPISVTLHSGDRIGQGMFKKVLRPNKNLKVSDSERTGGFGSTGR